MVNGLTLSKIIQLNTGIKDIPYNVFFSTKICKDVVKHQCVERESSDPSVLKTQLQQEKNRKAALQAKVDAMSKSTDELRIESATLEAVCIVLGVIIFLFLAALGVMFLRKKPNKHAGKNHDRKYCHDRRESAMQLCGSRRESTDSETFGRHNVTHVLQGIQRFNNRADTNATDMTTVAPGGPDNGAVNATGENCCTCVVNDNRLPTLKEHLEK